VADVEVHAVDLEAELRRCHLLLMQHVRKVPMQRLLRCYFLFRNCWRRANQLFLLPFREVLRGSGLVRSLEGRRQTP
jgi:hypothetical protein